MKYTNNRDAFTTPLRIVYLDDSQETNKTLLAHFLSNFANNFGPIPNDTNIRFYFKKNLHIINLGNQITNLPSKYHYHNIDD